ncbi:hypothetical protein KP77_28510 [Jeotgalibacillus alimentarius]|uniref:Uncharacterized protein n=1 Tax=Jeotgalibacillus alimentarius TaxID=135826 RepID=A0A0C2RV14_9BACL|nr:hypothetical protein [Jeotgalibacillus alimentarius]KIL45559.1 hypothetical protein KP77_28510 [Jeotgalibacillus alimentarius]
MKKYKKIMMNGDVYFREIDEATGFFESETMSEEELVELLLDEAIISEVEVNFEEIKRGIQSIPNVRSREIVEDYMDYLEELVSTLEQSHDIST